MSKLLVVFGATGQQGGSVIKTILADPKAKATFRLRGITRDASKPSATKLTAQGVEMVSADLTDKKSLRKALEGAYAVYGVTNYWELHSGEAELEQGKNLADISKEVGVQHFVWSSLLDVTKATKGKLSKVAHFDSKAHVEDYIRSIDLPASFYMPGFYMSNIPGGMMRQDPSGKWTFALPIPGDTSAIPLVDIAEDTGKFVKAILMNRDSTLGKNIYGAVDYYSPDRMVEEFKKVYPEAGATASFAQLPPDVFKGILGKSGMSEQAQEELLENMLLLGKDFGYYGGASLTESHKILDEPLTSWTEFIKTAPAFKDLK